MIDVELKLKVATREEQMSLKEIKNTYDCKHVEGPHKEHAYTKEPPFEIERTWLEFAVYKRTEKKIITEKFILPDTDPSDRKKIIDYLKS